jgi:hypothetical protein
VILGHAGCRWQCEMDPNELIGGDLVAQHVLTLLSGPESASSVLEYCPPPQSTYKTGLGSIREWPFALILLQYPNQYQISKTPDLRFVVAKFSGLMTPSQLSLKSGAMLEVGDHSPSPELARWKGGQISATQLNFYDAFDLASQIFSSDMFRCSANYAPYIPIDLVL